MEPNPSPKDQGENEDIIKLLKSWGSFKEEYPPELLASRRASFLEQIKQLGARPAITPIPPTEELVSCLESMQPQQVEYPPELLAARRAAFLAQVEQHAAAQEPDPAQVEEIASLVSKLKAVQAPYPPELLAARRAAFRAKVEQYNAAQEPAPAHVAEVAGLVSKLKSLGGTYPPQLFAARRADFKRRLALSGAMSLLDALYLSLGRLFQFKFKLPAMPMVSAVRSSVAVAVLLVVVFVGSLLNDSNPSLATVPTLQQIAQTITLIPSETVETAQTICKPGYAPPFCLAKESENVSDLTLPENGLARPAVAKDTVPGHGEIHRPAFLNDGLYGPGASWVSNSPNSWIKIDLGKATEINTVTFGRDRLGTLNDGDPGQFVVAVALSDNIYADGNSSMDYLEYTEVYNSEEDGFTGIVAGAETVRANFEPVTARFIKIIFANQGTAVDEVEVFMLQPTGFSNTPTRRPKTEPTRAPATLYPSSTPQPTNTPQPTDTPVPTDTSTPRPTRTPTDVPTSTPRPTRTPTPVPTDTPRPSNTPTDEPTQPPPTDPPPTDPPPTDTQEPPTSVPPPTDTREPAPVDINPTPVP